MTDCAYCGCEVDFGDMYCDSKCQALAHAEAKSIQDEISSEE